jgi:glycine/D-amino acid oxidase-like deaminating enzyme
VAAISKSVPAGPDGAKDHGALHDVRLRADCSEHATAHRCRSTTEARCVSSTRRIQPGRLRQAGARDRFAEPPDLRALGSSSHRRQQADAITHRWSAQGDYAADGIAYIGRSAASPLVYIATGFAADGLTYGTLAATIVEDVP